jgi:hypothetical protein
LPPLAQFAVLWLLGGTLKPVIAVAVSVQFALVLFAS